MKKIIAIAMILLCVFSLGACAKKDDGNTDGEPGGLVQPRTEENTEAKAELTAILNDIKDNYHPGTTGSSLTAVKYAAELLDFNAAEKLSAEETTQCVKDYCANLDAETAASFTEQINQIYGVSGELFAEGAKDKLETAGYESANFPWAKESADAFFTALYAGLGCDVPKAE